MNYEVSLRSIAEMMARKHHKRSYAGREGLEDYQKLHQSLKDKWIKLNMESAEIAMKNIEMEVRYLMGCQGKTEEQINTYLTKRGIIPGKEEE
jgi:hypothetical protein